MYKILVTLSFAEYTGRGLEERTRAMTTNVVEFETSAEADVAFDRLKFGYPKNAVHATAVKLY